MNIVGERITLRAIEESDLPALQRWANDPDIQSMLGGWHFPISERDQRKWFEALAFNSINQRFAIETEGEGLIGTTNIVSIDWQNRTAFHGMLLGEKAAYGKGYAQEVIKTIMQYSFDELGLERLDGDMIEYNEPSIRLYTEKCGWKVEGVKKNWYFRKGRRWDKIVVGVSKEDYYQLMNKSK
jgi:RimJ/RimL family protein N-acetyltransferase